MGKLRFEKTIFRDGDTFLVICSKYRVAPSETVEDNLSLDDFEYFKRDYTTLFSDDVL